MATKIVTEKAPGAIGPYSQGVIAGNMVYTSGQIPVDPATGKVADCVKEQTKQSLTNVKEVLAAAGCTMEDVFKTTVFIKDMNDFGAINEVYATFFTGDVLPARSCVEVARLPKDVKVEIEVIALKK
ncbi:RidA family protein [Acidaminobacterium chupaoyuni]